MPNRNYSIFHYFFRLFEMALSPVNWVMSQQPPLHGHEQLLPSSNNDLCMAMNRFFQTIFLNQWNQSLPIACYLVHCQHIMAVFPHKEEQSRKWMTNVRPNYWESAQYLRLTQNLFVDHWNGPLLQVHHGRTGVMILSNSAFALCEMSLIVPKGASTAQ